MVAMSQRMKQDYAVHGHLNGSLWPTIIGVRRRCPALARNPSYPVEEENRHFLGLALLSWVRQRIFGAGIDLNRLVLEIVIVLPVTAHHETM